MTGWKTYKVSCCYSPMPVDIRAPSAKVAAERFALDFLTEDGTSNVLEPEEVWVREPKETGCVKFLVTWKMIAKAVPSV